jgi:hypothetical protein
LGLLCWQNPVLAALSSGLFHSSASDPQLLAADVIQCIGLQIMWFTWIALTDGQRFFTKQARHHHSRAHGNPTDNTNGFTNGLASGHANGCTTAFASRVQNHHPASDFFLDFVLLKALYGALALCIGLSLCVLRHPAAVPGSVQRGVAALLLRLRIDAEQAYQGQCVLFAHDFQRTSFM